MKTLLALLCATSLGLLAVAVATRPVARTAVAKPAPVELGRGPIGEPTPPPALPASLALAGEVIDAGAEATGTITIRVGASTTSVSTSLPSWSATIAGAYAGDMVVVELDTATYRYTSVLGSYGRLARLAGTDARLDIGELDRLRLSPLSTALEVLVRKVVGREPATDVEHERAIRAVRSGDVDNVAGTLRRLAEQPAALPAGHSSGYSVVDDEAAFRAYGEDGPQGYYVADAPAVPFPPTQLAGNTLLQGAVPFDDLPVVGGDSGAVVLLQTASGYAVHTTVSRRNSRFVADVATPGELRLVPANPVYEDHVVVKRVDPAQPGTTVVERRWIQEERYRQVFTGDRVGLWVAHQSWYATYPQYPQAAPAWGSSNRVLRALKLARTGFYFPLRQALGRAFVGDKVLPAPCRVPGPLGDWTLDRCETAVHTFESGGRGTILFTDSKVNGAMEDTSWQFTRPMTWQPGFDGLPTVTRDGQVTQFWSVDSQDGVGHGVVYVSRTMDGADEISLAGESLMIDASAPATIDPDEMPGDWAFATFTQFGPGPYGAVDVANTIFRFRADGEVHQVERYRYMPDYDITRRMGWSGLGGIRIARFHGNVLQPRPYTSFPSCTAAYEAGASQCIPLSVRYFQPMRRVGSRIYGLEDLYTNRTPNRTQPPFDIARSSRVTYYEKLDPTPEARDAGAHLPVPEDTATQRLR